MYVSACMHMYMYVFIMIYMTWAVTWRVNIYACICMYMHVYACICHCGVVGRGSLRDSLSLWRSEFDPYRRHSWGVVIDVLVHNCFLLVNKSAGLPRKPPTSTTWLVDYKACCEMKIKYCFWVLQTCPSALCFGRCSSWCSTVSMRFAAAYPIILTHTAKIHAYLCIYMHILTCNAFSCIVHVLYVLVPEL
jgi:hypothetical protein